MAGSSSWLYRGSAAWIALAGTVGCSAPLPVGASTTSGGGTHTDGAGDEPIPPTSTETLHLEPNTPTNVVAGTQAGYGIRTLAGTSTFRILWTGDGDVGGGYHEFWGTVWTTGHFSAEVPGCSTDTCPLESGDLVSAPYATSGGQRVDWDTFASDGLDGFEVTTDTLPLYFDMFIDGQRIPQLVFFPDNTNPGQYASPTVIPFALTAP